MEIAKAHSLGNDFLVIRRSGPPGEGAGDLTRKLCDRHTGAGADGVLFISVEDAAAGRVGFRIFNADGTEAEISGNGLRCAAATLYHDGTVTAPRILFTTTAGERPCELLARDGNLFSFRVDMGVPRFSSAEIPFDDGSSHDRIVDYPLTIQQRVLSITCVNVGNPHCIVFVERFFPARVLWNQIGLEIESHPFFPNRTNVEFVRVINKQEIEVLFWERGVGETMSSGSGSCAAAVAAMLKGLTLNEIKVWTGLGQITVRWENSRIFQSGPAEVVFLGNYLG
jgi:diaminopimelate epimerase